MATHNHTSAPVEQNNGKTLVGTALVHHCTTVNINTIITQTPFTQTLGTVQAMHYNLINYIIIGEN